MGVRPRSRSEILMDGGGGGRGVGARGVGVKDEVPHRVQGVPGPGGGRSPAAIPELSRVGPTLNSSHESTPNHGALCAQFPGLREAFPSRHAFPDQPLDVREIQRDRERERERVRGRERWEGERERGKEKEREERRR